MRFANSIRLLMENFKHAFKLLLYRVIMMLIVVALCSAFVLPEIVEILEADVTKEFISNFKNIFVSLVEHDTTSPSHYVEMVFGENGNLKQLFDFLITMKLELILVCIGCVVVYLLKRFVDTLVYFTIGSMVNDKMATYTDTPFFTAFVANLGKASAYAALYVPIVFVFDMVSLSLCFIMMRFLPLLTALFLGMTMIAVLQSVKLTFTSQWMPAITADGESLRKAIQLTKGRRKQVKKTLCLYVVMVYLIVILNMMAGVFTFGSALLITIPTSYLLLICTQYVNYYTIKGKKYFITYDAIATNTDHGDSEHFFEYMEEMEKEEGNAVVNEQENE